ncbi:MAG: aspartate kinase [Blastopirellula sp.]|nr:aspartate kinase [Blastopirellula sp.]
MPLIVQKFGGTSVADTEKILAAARKAIRAQQQGNHVVMVVSAMGKNTDLLVDLAAEISERPAAREMDMLLSTGEQVSVALMAMAIHSLGHQAVSLTGAQIGIKTDSTHTKARIKSISTERMQRLLDEGNIVIAAGFQGIDEDFNITTLGRGGSDTTAVALAAVLDADACEIYTDVDGVYTTDPRKLPEARRVTQISYDEMLELASLGAGVMHSRSIEFAKKYGVPIHVRSSMTDIPGTVIAQSPETRERPVSGAAVTRDEARVSVLGVPDVPGTSFEIFSRIADRKVTVDMIVQNVGAEGRADVSFTVPKEELDETLEAVNAALEVVGAGTVTHSDDVSKVSVVGLGMAQQSGVAEKMFRAVSEAGINIEMITTSEIKISVLVSREHSQDALRAVHDAFNLHQDPATIEEVQETTRQAADVADVVARLRGIDMEELFLNDIQLDQTQARVTIHGAPDTPGGASTVFQEVAAAGIFVDMIVQSYNADEQRANLGFTVPRDQHDATLDVATRLAETFACEGTSSSPNVAKLSVSGVGLRSHTSVAIRMFRALSEAGINVEVISTSEVRVNAVVDGEQGEQALHCLQAAFADVLR